MTKYTAVGIDLGTTYSAMACIDESGHTRLIPNAEGDLLTPSVVLFEDDRVLVGKEAKRLGTFDAERMVECAKREMGNQFYSRAICGRQLPPEVIQAFVLRKMKADLTPVVGQDPRAVITVPAFFDEPRRKATVDAAQMAGLHVLDIVNEPTAAALAFGEELGFLKENATSKERMNVLVYDLGGGTFDATLIEMQAGNLRTIATDGDVRLGGRDWDMALVDYCSQQFMKESQQDPREDFVTLVRMLAHAEEIKHTLTARASAGFKIQYAGHTSEIKVTRDIFEEETAHLLERTAYVTRQLLTASGMHWSDLHRILLVGGSTRMPMVDKMLADRTGIQPDRSVNPDEAVARGAAVFADYLLTTRDSRRKPSFVVTNVNSHSLGIEGVDQQTGRKRNNIIIQRNSPLPVKKTERFVTRSENQKSVVVKVLEGESSEPTECTSIGRTAIRDLPTGLKAGSPIHVTYEYGTNGRLNVRAKVQGTDREVLLELERENSLSNAMVAQWARLVESHCGIAQFDQYLGGRPSDHGSRPAPQPQRQAPPQPVSAAAPKPSPAPKAAPAPRAQPAAAAPVATLAPPVMPAAPQMARSPGAPPVMAQVEQMPLAEPLDVQALAATAAVPLAPAPRPSIPPWLVLAAGAGAGAVILGLGVLVWFVAFR